MTPDEVRGAMGLPFSSFWKTPDSPYPTDAFDDAGVHVYYESPGVCDAVELWGDAEVYLGPHQLLRINCFDARAILRSLDAACEEDDSAVTSTRLGVSLSCSGGDDDARTEAVLVTRPGYWS
jgi:hypothetical protein